MDMQLIEEFYSQQQKRRQIAALITKKNSEYNKAAMGLPPEHLLKLCYAILSSQQYGPFIEKYTLTRTGMTKVQGSGDIINTHGIIFEVKSSISDDLTFNIVQVRPFETDVSWYLLIFGEVINNNIV